MEKNALQGPESPQPLDPALFLDFAPVKLKFAAFDLDWVTYSLAAPGAPTSTPNLTAASWRETWRPSISASSESSSASTHACPGVLSTPPAETDGE